MYDKENFLSWSDDIDLDALLECYTESETAEFSDEDFEPSPAKKSKTATTTPSQPSQLNTPCYQCPDCDKTYKSIAGFRGHVRQKHGITSIKVSEHRKDGITEKINNKTSFSMTPEEFTKIFETSYQEALENIINSPFRNSSRSKNGKGILAITLYYATSQQTHTQLSEELAPVFANLFEKVESDCNTDLNTSEKLFSSFYKITVDNEFQSKLSAIVTSEFENIEFEGELSAKLFLSVLQDALLKSLVKNRSQLYQKNATKLDTTMTNSDQSVLYYISGYIISKLQKKTYQHKNLKNQKIREAITNFVVKQSTMLQEHVKKFAEWTEKLNRGGLKIPSDNFYYFIRHCEIVLRQSIDLGNVNSQTLMITNLKEVIVSAHMVNYYWEILCDNNEFSSYIMESCVSLFLTIRGHSLARAVQLQMPNSTSQHEKPLRKVLKDKSDNRKQ